MSSFRRPIAVLMAWAAAGCATVPSRPVPSKPPAAAAAEPDAPAVEQSAARPRRAPEPQGESASEEKLPTLPGDRGRAVQLARSLVGKRSIRLHGKRYPNDCTGLVLAVYEQIGLHLFSEAERGDSGVRALHRYAERHGRIYRGWPVLGDLVFFRDTYDQNGDGRSNDGLTHVGLVDEIRADGTIFVIHRSRKGVVRDRMNLKHPDVRIDPQSGQVWNDYLRARTWIRPAALTGQLFASYGTVLAPAALTAAR